jgi:cAMP phosphodiesterase
MTPQIFVDGKYIDIECKLTDDSVFSVSLTKEEAITFWRKLAEGITMMELQQIFIRTEIK